MKALHFGAGNIGRGFIGLLLNHSGYEVCFADVVQELVDEINRRREYIVEMADHTRQQIRVKGVRAINSRDLHTVVTEMLDANLITTAVGPNVLQRIAPTIAEGLSERFKKNAQPLNLIACENMVGGSSLLKEAVYHHLSEADRKKADELVGFPNAAVDRIVPLQKHEDKLLVTVEPFYEWVVDRSAIVGEIPDIKGITYVDDLQPYIERKLYTVNTGHATAAYLSYHFGYQTIAEGLQDPYIRQVTEQAMAETSRLLVAKHSFQPEQQEQYRNKILDRFSNPHLADQVTRIGRSPIRKLGPDDRLVGPAVQSLNYGIIPENLCIGIASAFLFDYAGDEEAVQIQKDIKEKGLAETVQLYTKIKPDSPLFPLILEKLDDLKARKN
ncbi:MULTISPECIES: mannitol-1-phosphate 5-dehydrogenase [Thermoactinomyces]|jgi:mannitol-1-phosphate 5-dehydrogenase|uniref:Mannitol-1-phosphate 5-dehydrogenase n=1 Tax=Thermoactinomyces daqus TaxID=1329516 RepID=A0A7W2AIU2_9BACL|nr:MULTISPECIES: mannitol-1-phosphate 5-dehydrogenase [Thermoactinomyces]MBA4544096.1 mannitol-1-phosphate 5-dehydrogenase [Thermoactinomyces daqus]MBH8605312.1 mannitol-1-phosphate 5-dehydrogenase [Thermoactinomyces sp. CICC 10522]MBH8608223.1 mannitol-1-phosphate 5-dehydrogenase [Thermoactinomyces sp. CICC 10521]